MVRMKKYALLHIGKTGGTSLNLLLQDVKKDQPDLPIQKLSHGWTLDRCAEKRTSHAEKRTSHKVGFVIRCPFERFVSGFNSRLRAGRPAHPKTWSGMEASVFSFFPNANLLAESLYSSDERMRSAAEFSMQTIGHLRRGYEFHLGSVENIKNQRARIYCVRDLETLDETYWDFFVGLRVANRETFKPLPHAHRAHQNEPSVLSELAKRNLKQFWQAEFEIYDYCKT